MSVDKGHFLSFLQAQTNISTQPLVTFFRCVGGKGKEGLRAFTMGFWAENLKTQNNENAADRHQVELPKYAKFYLKVCGI